jgi:hypothetical protein
MVESFFAPGTLSLSRSETLAACKIDAKKYTQHYSQDLCMMAPEHKLTYYLLPKSASSTNRDMMEKLGKTAATYNYKQCDKFKGNKRVSFVRNPLTRMYAQYEEMMARSLNRIKDGHIPERFRRFIEGYSNYKEYDADFATPERLSKRFEYFMEDWDTTTLWDSHLALQVPLLSDHDGYGFHLDWLGDVKSVDADWTQIFKDYNIPTQEIIKGRSFPRRLNITLLSAETIHRVCRFAAPDLCCLNYPLPAECAQSGVKCMWSHDEHDPTRHFISPYIEGEH